MNSIQVTPVKPILTKLERKWYNEYLKDFNTLEAMRRVKKNELSSGQILDNVVRSLSYQVRDSALQKLGITDNDIRRKMGLSKENLDRKLAEKMEAKDTIVVRGRDKDGGPKIMKVDNHAVQLKAVELAYKLTGELNNKLEVTGGTDNKITVEFVDDTRLKSIHSLEGETVE